MFALGDGSFSFGPVSTGNSFDATLISSSYTCMSPTVTTEHTDNFPEAIAYLISIADLAHLVEDPKNPGHYTGKSVFLHDEQPRAGGSQIIDITVEWDLQRKPER